MNQIFWLIVIVSSVNALILDTSLLDKDLKELKAVFENAVNENDLSSIFYGLAGQKHLGKITVAAKACENAQKLVNERDVESLYYAGGISETIGTSCQLQLPKSEATILAAINVDTSASSLFYAASAAKSLQIKIDNKKLAEALTAVSKKDNSASNLSFIFNAVAVALDEQTAAQYILRIEECIAQTDEIDKKYLSFEGGLTPTAFAVTGIYNLAQKAKKAPSIKPDQVLKLANYLLSRKGVRLARPAYNLLQALQILTRNQFHYPIVFTRVSSTTITSSNPNIKIRVSDVFGRPVDGLNVVALAQDVNSKTALFSKKALKHDATNKLFELNLLEAKPVSSFYRITFSASSADARLVGNVGAEFAVNLATEITVEDAQIALVDSDQQISSSNAHKLPSFSKYSSVFDADTHQKLSMQFKIKDKTTNAATKVHQSFVVFTHVTSKREIAFVIESDLSKLYSFGIDFSKAVKDFDYQSGKYAVKLILGDALVSNSIEWIVADINIKFPVREKVTESSVEHISFEKKPEITHVFRPADKRPSAVVSDLFIGLVLLPLLLLFILWLRIGANLSNLSFDLYTFGFHIGLAGIFVLYFVFWLELNMFQTLKYLTAIGCFTFLTGNKMLRHMADKRKSKTE